MQSGSRAENTYGSRSTDVIRSLQLGEKALKQKGELYQGFTSKHARAKAYGEKLRRDAKEKAKDKKAAAERDLSYGKWGKRSRDWKKA